MKRIVLCIALIAIYIGIFDATSAASKEIFDRYGGWKGLKGEKTGWFHTQKIGNRWWLITPEGNAFFSLGVYCVRISGIPETGTGKRAYRDNCLKIYGNEEEWATVSLARLKEWGFNTIGDWSSRSIFSRPGMAYVMGIDLPRDAPNVIPKGAYGYFPDIFDPIFEKSVGEKIEQKINWYPELVRDPWLLGYFIADEPSWYGSRGRRGALVDDFIALPEDSYGKKAWVDFLIKKYEKIERLNQAWGKNFKDFNELLRVKRIEDEPELIAKDKLEFFKFVAEEFSRKLVKSLREYDSNHLILGSRPSRNYPEIVEAIGKYSDVFGISYYHLNQGYKIDPRFSEVIEYFSKTSGGKPVLLGVLITAKDTGLPYGMVNTQQERGISYWRYLKEVASNPYIVGLHWFQYFDPPRRCYDARASNWGLVNEKDEPYEDAVNLISQANKMVYAYSLGLSQFAPKFNSIFGIRKEKVKEIDKGPLKRITVPISNAGFEKGRRFWSFQTWQGKSKTTIDTVIKHSGKMSLKITGGPEEGWKSVGVGVQYNPDFVLKPDYQYKLSTWIKAEKVEHSGFLRIKVKYQSGGVDYFGTPAVYGTKDWKYVEVKFRPREENTVEYLGAQLVGRGIVWFDDIALEVMAPEGITQKDFVKAPGPKPQAQSYSGKLRQLYISNPGFEQGKKDWSFQTWKGRPRIGIDGRTFHSGKRSVKIKGSGSGWDSVGVAVRGNLGIVLKPQLHYRLSGWVKTKAVEDGAFLRIKVKYEDGRVDYFQTNSLVGTGDWEKITKEFQPRARNKIEYLAAQLVGKGVAWFDDITIEEVVEE